MIGKEFVVGACAAGVITMAVALTEAPAGTEYFGRIRDNVPVVTNAAIALADAFYTKDEVDQKIGEIEAGGGGGGADGNAVTNIINGMVESKFGKGSDLGQVLWSQSSFANEHGTDTNNPHNVTAEQIGALTDSDLEDVRGQVNSIGDHYNELNASVGEISGAVAAWERYWVGSNVWWSVTNYMRTVAGVVPALELHEIRDGTNKTVWADLEKFDIFAQAWNATLTNATESCRRSCSNELATAVANMPDRAWSLYTSGTGALAPENTTWVSTPTTVIAGGLEYQRWVRSQGFIAVLKSNGMVVQMSGDKKTGYFRVEDAEGNALFCIEKTDSYEVGCNPASTGWGTGADAGKFLIGYNVTSADHPTLITTASLADQHWLEEGQDSGVSVEWRGSSGAWIAVVTCSNPSLFVRAKYTQEGSVAVKHSAPATMDGGIIIGEKKYNLVPKTVGGELVMGLVEAR